MCIKLVIWKSLYYEARSEKHQIVEKYGTAGQATDDIIKRRMCFITGKLRQAYRPTLKMFPIYLLSTATMVTRMSLSVTLYISFLFCRL